MIFLLPLLLTGAELRADIARYPNPSAEIRASWLDAAAASGDTLPLATVLARLPEQSEDEQALLAYDRARRAAWVGDDGGVLAATEHLAGDSDFVVRAQFLRADSFIHTDQRKNAVRIYVELVNRGPADVRDLALLRFAELYASIQQFTNAVTTTGGMSYASRFYGSNLALRARSQLYQIALEPGLGLLTALNGPYRNTWFDPELEALAAMGFTAYCYVPEARWWLDRLDRRDQALSALSEGVSPLSRLQAGDYAAVDPGLHRWLLEDPEIASLVRLTTALAQESPTVSDLSLYTDAANSLLSRRLGEGRRRIDAAQRLTRQSRARLGLLTSPTPKNQDAERSPCGPAFEPGPFDGELWVGELESYRFQAVSNCPLQRNRLVCL